VEALQFIPLAPEISQRVSSFRLVLLGLAMVLVLRFRPRGLLGWLP
jgi:ABC-type branched-subunit amino acid transport system permease subunit